MTYSPLAVLGVDPGVKGGLAVVTCDGVRSVYPLTAIDKEEELDLLLREAAAEMQSLSSPIAFVEKVGAMPTDGRQGAFTFGKIYGLLLGGLRAYGLRLHHVYPAMWQSALGCLTRGNKNVSKNKAISLFQPFHDSHGITHATADAILIAEYGRRRLLGGAG